MSEGSPRTVVRREGEHIDSLLNRFRRAVMDGGITADARRALAFESRRDEAKRKSARTRRIALAVARKRSQAR